MFQAIIYAISSKTTEPNLKNDKKSPLILCPILVYLAQASYALFQPIVVCNFKDNKWTKLEKMTKNLVSGLILAPLTQILVQKFVFVDFTYTRC